MSSPITTDSHPVGRFLRSVAEATRRNVRQFLDYGANRLPEQQLLEMGKIPDRRSEPTALARWLLRNNELCRAFEERYAGYANLPPTTPDLRLGLRLGQEITSDNFDQLAAEQRRAVTAVIVSLHDDHLHDEEERNTHVTRHRAQPSDRSSELLLIATARLGTQHRLINSELIFMTADPSDPQGAAEALAYSAHLQATIGRFAPDGQTATYAHAFNANTSSRRSRIMDRFKSVRRVSMLHSPTRPQSTRTTWTVQAAGFATTPTACVRGSASMRQRTNTP